MYTNVKKSNLGGADYERLFTDSEYKARIDHIVRTTPDTSGFWYLPMHDPEFRAYVESMRPELFANEHRIAAERAEYFEANPTAVPSVIGAGAAITAAQAVNEYNKSVTDAATVAAAVKEDVATYAAKPVVSTPFPKPVTTSSPVTLAPNTTAVTSPALVVSDPLPTVVDSVTGSPIFAAPTSAGEEKKGSGGAALLAALAALFLFS